MLRIGDPGANPGQSENFSLKTNSGPTESILRPNFHHLASMCCYHKICNIVIPAGVLHEDK